MNLQGTKECNKGGPNRNKNKISGQKLKIKNKNNNAKTLIMIRHLLLLFTSKL